MDFVLSSIFPNIMQIARGMLHFDHQLPFIVLFESFAIIIFNDIFAILFI